jgi:Flp pilus assembly protein TadD
VRRKHCGATLVAAGLAALIVAIGLTLPPTRGAAQVDDQARYDACMVLAREKPDEGLRTATAWEKEGGGPAARHCAAVSMVGQQKFREAAALMEKVADEQMGENQTKVAAGLLGQAGQAWLMAGDTEKAFAAQSRGLDLNPQDLELRIDAGLTLAYQKRYWEALDEFNLAHEKAPQRADVIVFMASAYRYVEAFDLARDLIGRALSLEPNNPDALLERGILRRLADDNAGARADWQKVVDLAASTPAGNAAKANLRRLDSGADKFAPASETPSD